MAHLIGWAHQYFNKLINPPKILIYHHHDHRSVLPKGRSFIANSGTKAAVLPKFRNQGCSFKSMKTGYYTCSSVWKREKIHLLSPSIYKMLMKTHKTHPPRWPNPSINKRKRERERDREREIEREIEREREKYTRAGPQSHTQTRNFILVEEQIYVQYSCSRPLHHVFQMCALLDRPTVARDGKSIYLAMKMYRYSRVYSDL